MHSVREVCGSSGMWSSRNKAWEDIRMHLIQTTFSTFGPCYPEKAKTTQHAEPGAVRMFTVGLWSCSGQSQSRAEGQENKHRLRLTNTVWEEPWKRQNPNKPYRCGRATWAVEVETVWGTGVTGSRTDDTTVHSCSLRWPTEPKHWD